MVQPKNKKSMKKTEEEDPEEVKHIEELQPVIEDPPVKSMNLVYAVSAAAVATIGFVVFKVMRR